MVRHCEALLCCKLDRRRRQRCTALAEEQREGRWVCWVHGQAYDNPHRAMPLRFIAELDDRNFPELAHLVVDELEAVHHE